MDSATICNQALSAIGARGRITAITEQSVEAAECALWYPTILLDLLAMSRWQFARRTAALSLLKARKGTPENPNGTLTADPEYPWLYSYAYPSDCVAARYIMPIDLATTLSGVPLTSAQSVPPFPPLSPSVRFILGTELNATTGQPVRNVLTNQSQAQLVYVFLATDPNLWSNLFRTAFVGRLASRICQPLSGDKTLLKIAMAAGQRAEDDAAEAAGNEGITVIDMMPEALAARGYIDDFGGSPLYYNNSTQDVD